MTDQELLSILACPGCRAALREEARGGDGELSSLRCSGCGRGYPVRDGILHLLIEDATDGPEPHVGHAQQEPGVAN